MLMIGEGGVEGDFPFSPAAFHVYVPDADAAFQRAIAAGFYLYVPDTDALYAQAVAAGATAVAPPTDQSYGDRMGSVMDSEGIT